VGVLYPDMTKIRTLGAYYVDFDPPSSRAMLKTRAPSQASR
jgi:hypothetical protein